MMKTSFRYSHLRLMITTFLHQMVLGLWFEILITSIIQHESKHRVLQVDHMREDNRKECLLSRGQTKPNMNVFFHDVVPNNYLLIVSNPILFIPL